MTTTSIDRRPEQDIVHIISRTSIHMIIHDKGMGYSVDNDEKLGLTLEDIPVFITDLQKEGILPDNGKYVQYATGASTEDEQRRGETDNRAKLIVFDKEENLVAILPQREVLALQDVFCGTEIRYGLKQDGYVSLVNHLL